MNETIEAANARLSLAFNRLGYSLGETAGVIDEVTVHDRLGRYLFAWHKHENHLLFYLRKPALEAQSTLRQRAIARHAPELVNRNHAKETTIRLTSDSDAETLLGWLLPTLPLPSTAR
jgi:hypothetical protein